MPDNPQQASESTAPQPDFSATDPYLVLGISPAAGKLQIKRAYFALIKQYSPEKDAEKFKIIRGAYEKLKNAEQRAETDALLPKAPPPLPAVASRYASVDGIKLNSADALFALKQEGDLGRVDFKSDFREVDW